MALVGRQHELDVLAEHLEKARVGMSSALVVLGEAGVGKTALLRHVIGSAEGFQVASVSGFESEVDLGFATLHRLLLGFDEALDALPARQRDALATAFGLRDGTPPDPFMVGLATLTLLTDVAATQPLLCVIDDAQWIDDASLSILTFVARRLHADHVAMLFGVRESGTDLAMVRGLAELRVGDLEGPDARSLLETVPGGSFDPRVAQRIVQETGGNPLALLELGRELGADERDGSTPLPDLLPIGADLEARYSSRVQALPVGTRRLLLLAAAEPGEPETVWRAADHWGVDADDAIRPAVDARLVHGRRYVEFRHPLVRSAVYQGAAPSERRRAHELLASVMDPPQADRRAWHLASAAVGLDGEVATALELAADRARSRGGRMAEVKFLDRAAQLTGDQQERSRRLLAASYAAQRAGAPALATKLVDRATKAAPDELAAGHALRLRGLIESSLGRFQHGPRNLFDAARSFASHDRALARMTLLETFTAQASVGRYLQGVSPEEIAAFALSVPADAPEAPQDLLLEGWSRLLIGDRKAGTGVLRRAIHALARDDVHRDEAARWALLGSLAARELWDDETYMELNTRNVQRLRELGDLTDLQIALLSLAAGYVQSGQLGAAETCYAEVRLLKHAIAGTSDLSEVVDLQLRAWRGHDEGLRATARGIYEFSDAIGFGSGVCIAQLALTTVELSEGQYSLALTAAREALGGRNPGIECRALADIVEAAERAGERATSQEAFDRLAPRLLESETDWGLGVHARLAGLLAPDESAQARFEEAIERLQRTKVVPDLARTHLLHGEWLRRRNRRVDARVQLRTAYDLFTSMGATGYADRAQSELLATGERARRRTVDTNDDLTPQEHQVARLAAGGATNREIATQLFLSTATVDYHLRKAFRKLDITSRRQLSRALPD
jgi:DNA-binding CsgD family transcriptional regulator